MRLDLALYTICCKHKEGFLLRQGIFFSNRSLVYAILIGRTFLEGTFIYNGSK